jgi:cytochrome subunit of sulfide dehydrogenase
MRSLLAGLVLALGSAVASAQQPAPPAPNFAASNLSPKGVQSMASACAMCHGTNGKTVANSSVAALAGRSRDEIVQAMAQFKAGTKPATIMHQVARGYSDAEVAALADYFSAQAR